MNCSVYYNVLCEFYGQSNIYSLLLKTGFLFKDIMITITLAQDKDNKFLYLVNHVETS